MKLGGKTFCVLANSSHGSATSDTRMTFLSDTAGVYSGGSIATGQVVAQRKGDSTVEMLYQCITTSGEMKAGQALARFSHDSDNRLRMHLDWQWLTGDRATGSSEWVLET